MNPLVLPRSGQVMSLMGRPVKGSFAKARLVEENFLQATPSLLALLVKERLAHVEEVKFSQARCVMVNYGEEILFDLNLLVATLLKMGRVAATFWMLVGLPCV